jgi:hypothetical protein
MKLDLTTIRVRAINASIKVLNKARPKELTPGQLVQRVIDNPDMSNEDRADILISLAKEVSNA